MMFDIQRNIKRNTEDVQNYVADIAEWQSDMKTKEKKLKEGKIT